MVVFFGRSFSFQSKPNYKPKPKPKPKNPGLLKPSTLPCPVLAQLAAEANVLRDWQSESEPQSGSHSWLCSGMARLGVLHASLDKLIRLPHFGGALTGCAIDRVLDDLLLLADAHGAFRVALMDLSHHQSAARAAFRRHHAARLASSIRALRKTEKELFKLSSDSSSVFKPFTSNPNSRGLLSVVRDVVAIAASTAAAIFLGVAAASATTSAVAFCSSSAAPSWMARPMLRRLSSSKMGLGREEEKAAAWRRSAIQRLEGMEECLASLDAGNERLLKILLDARVHLLNFIDPTII